MQRLWIVILMCTGIMLAGDPTFAQSQPIRSQFYKIEFLYPRTWEVQSNPFASAVIFKAGGYQVAMEYQLNQPPDPARALADFLIHRADMGTDHHLIPRWQPKHSQTHDLGNGTKLHEMSLTFQGNVTAIISGFAVWSEHGTVLLGSGMEAGEYETRYMRDYVNQQIAEYDRLHRIVASVAQHITWKPEGITRDQSLETWLMQKGSLNYHSEGFIPSTSGGVSFSDDVQWRFGTNRSVEYAQRHFSSFSDNSYNMFGNPDFSWAGGSGNQSRQGTHFEVHRKDQNAFIVVFYPSGLTTFHLLQTNPFAIDGRRDGCC